MRQAGEGNGVTAIEPYEPPDCISPQGDAARVTWEIGLGGDTAREVRETEEREGIAAMVTSTRETKETEPGGEDAAMPLREQALPLIARGLGRMKEQYNMEEGKLLCRCLIRKFKMEVLLEDEVPGR